MILIELRDAIIAGIKEASPTLVDVASHGGRFSLEEIKAVGAKSPAARVACLGLREITFEGNIPKAVSLWGVFIITAHTAAAKRDAVAMSIVAAIAPLLPEESWGLEASIDGAKECRADNLFSRELDKNGLALWGLSFTHQVDLNRIDPADLEAFITAHIDYDLAPADGTIDASDHLTLPQT